ncbi:hypothetical protein [Lentzea roselyniae]|uniref:hypothetical protein n=1 Tax=Lentzea roselyniae TaxID=531940 RepID=UPI0031F891A7
MFMVVLGLAIATVAPVPAHAFDSGAGFPAIGKKFQIKNLGNDKCVSVSPDFRGAYIGYADCSAEDVLQQFRIEKGPRLKEQEHLDEDDPALNILRTAVDKSPGIPDLATFYCLYSNGLDDTAVYRSKCYGYPDGQWLYKKSEKLIFGGVAGVELRRGCWRADKWGPNQGGGPKVRVVECKADDTAQQWQVDPLD